MLRGARSSAATWPACSRSTGDGVRRLDVIAVGELNPDLILTGMSGLPRLGRETLAVASALTLGSSTALCAANLAALGLRVGMVGKIGDDLFGDFVLRELGARQIETRGILREAGASTGITVSLATPEDRAMVTCPGAMARLAASEVDRAYLAEARHLHISSLFLQRGLQAGCAELFREAQAIGLGTSLDPGWDPVEAWDAGIEALYPWLDVLFVNAVEVCALGREADEGRAAARLAARVPLLVVKRGPGGAAAFQGGDTCAHPGFAAASVDPTGAGDAFNAGFLFGHLAGRPLSECLRWGNACGALTVGRPGGSGAYRDRAEVEEFLRMHTGTHDH
jgi:sugar/nucleoside kinase (ribokinase family)